MKGMDKKIYSAFTCLGLYPSPFFNFVSLNCKVNAFLRHFFTKHLSSANMLNLPTVVIS